MKTLSLLTLYAAALFVACTQASQFQQEDAIGDRNEKEILLQALQGLFTDDGSQYETTTGLDKEVVPDSGEDLVRVNWRTFGK